MGCRSPCEGPDPKSRPILDYELKGEALQGGSRGLCLQTFRASIHGASFGSRKVSPIVAFGLIGKLEGTSPFPSFLDLVGF